MNSSEIFHEFITGMKETPWLEYVAVTFGIASVIFQRMEKILGYPVGMLNTSIFIYIYITHGLYADALVNFYYTVMSIIGWNMWARKIQGHAALIITRSNFKDWLSSIIFFGVFFIILLILLKKFTDSTVPEADAFTSAAAFTGMWLLNKKKIENWIWWIITNLASIPLNFYKHLVFTSFQYLVFLILAIMGYTTWRKKLNGKYA